MLQSGHLVAFPCPNAFIDTDALMRLVVCVAAILVLAVVVAVAVMS